MTIDNLLNRVKALDTDKIAVEALTDTKDTIADLNTEQINKGFTKTGAEITPAYSPVTIEIKEKKGQITSHVTLQDTGAFYRGIYTDVTNNSVITDSKDEKSEKLKKKYADIFGLSDKFKREYINERLQPAFNSKIEKDLNLKI